MIPLELLSIRGRLVLGIACGLLLGLLYSGQAVRVFAVRNAPVVTGHVLARKPMARFLFPGADLTIQIVDSGAQVRARIPRYLTDKIPDTVRFRYDGDPARDVFLSEYEHSPYLVIALGWGGALVLALLYMRESRHRRVLQRQGQVAREAAD